MNNFPSKVQTMFNSDERIVRVVYYENGWVPNSYKWRAPGSCTVYLRDGTVKPDTYDRKRSGGAGPLMVGFSEKGGRLASW